MIVSILTVRGETGNHNLLISPDLRVEYRGACLGGSVSMVSRMKENRNELHMHRVQVWRFFLDV